ncbi:hypothetical protein LCGC14_1552960 [marine sediment metagenome]|uniref:Uncharacterized protein n=1 Tax=marine sediment metagenome TaxID=412755 RepID=A0A0F9IPV6_9ZZZZ
MFNSKYIYLKMLKKWGGFQVGDVVRFSRTKGEGRITSGDGELVKKQQAVNDPVPEKKNTKIETAMHTPKSENAMLDTKASPDAKAKAKAEADEKADAEAKAKAKNEAKAKADAEAKAKNEGKDDKKGKDHGNWRK